MPSVTFTLTDTPAGGVAVHTNFNPAAGAPCSPAQAAALEIISRSRRTWGLDMPGIVDRQVKPSELRRRARDGSSL